jgi:chromosome segregation ATPase
LTAGAVTSQRGEATGAATSNEPPHLRATLPSECDQLRAAVKRLTAENERYRAHAERTSKLYLAVTDYAEWVRESARRDAELALRKARTRVERLEATARELEQTERERARLQNELERLQAAIDETRARLSAFLTAGLQALNSEKTAQQGDANEPGFGELQDELHGQLPSIFGSEAGHPVDVERLRR